MNKPKKHLTKHAAERIVQRSIPAAMVREAVKNGRKKFNLDRKSVEHRMKNVLGINGVDLVVITAETGEVITSYVEKKNVKRML
jgi:20S proteasome alpha/beta subunit